MNIYDQIEKKPGGWMDGWVLEVKGFLRIAYSSQNAFELDNVQDSRKNAKNCIFR